MDLSKESYNAFLFKNALILISSIAVISFSCVYYKYYKKKEVLVKRDPVNFDLFVKANSMSIKKKENTNGEEVTISDDMISVPILYGTEFGFSKEISEKLCNQIKMKYKRYWPYVMDMADHHDGLDLKNEQIIFIICSTQGDGVPPAEARQFCNWLRNANSLDLSSLSFSICALGDRTYSHFCQCGKMLENVIKGYGGKSIVKRHDIDREDWKTINEWIDNVIDELPKINLKTIKERNGVLLNNNENGKVIKTGKKHSMKLKMLRIENLCKMKDNEDKNTFVVDFDNDGFKLSYISGDALGIYAMNCPEEVDELLKTLNIKDDFLIEIPPWEKEFNIYGINEDKITIKEAFMKYYDLKNPKIEIFQLIKDIVLKKLTGNGILSTIENKIELLNTLINNQEVREKYLYERHIIDIIIEFEIIAEKDFKITELLQCMRMLQPRLYSISSSPLENPNILSITIALVKYTSLGKERKGVVSNFLYERIKIGMDLPIFISSNPDFRLPKQLSTPIIMVGPGTGIAPFISFIKERIELKMNNNEDKLEMLLFFGCRNRDQDFLYKDLLESWHQNNHIKLYTAFSREQKEKIYVQNKLMEIENEIWDLLENKGAHFYLCGDANKMAKDVKKCLKKIISLHVPNDSNKSKEYLKKLAKSQRFQRDIWYG